MHPPTTLLLPLLLSLLPLSTLASSVTTEYLITNKCTRKTTKGDKIDVHYRGTLASDGTEFDASYNRGMPLTFTVGNGMVIKGWDEGLLDMCIGDKRKLTIPPEFGYGNRATGPIPAGATLIFETELIGIAGVTKEEPEPESSAEASGTEEVEPVAEEAPGDGEKVEVKDEL